MIKAQTWLNKKYPNKEQVKEIELEKEILIAGQLQVENFPHLKKMSVKGGWNNWGKLTELVVRNCPKLVELDCSYNEIKNFTIANCPQLCNFDFSNQSELEELARFNGSRLNFNIVSYIGSLDDDLYQQLKNGLPGDKHEDLQRLCFGCLTGGGHGNKSDYHYHAEVELTKGGIIEYGVTATGNQRETCEIPERGGLLIIDINSTDDGTIKIKKKGINKIEKVSGKEFEIELLKSQINFLEKQVGEIGVNLAQFEVELNKKQEQLIKLDDEINCSQSEKKKIKEIIRKLEEKLQEINDEQWKKQLLEGKKDLEKKLEKVEEKLAESEIQKKDLEEKMKELQNRQSNLQETKREELNELTLKWNNEKSRANELAKKLEELETKQMLVKKEINQVLNGYLKHFLEKVEENDKVLKTEEFDKEEQKLIKSERMEYEAKIEQSRQIVEKISKL